jgi:hypothetical protein
VPLFFVAYAIAFGGYVLAIGTGEGRSLHTVMGWGLVFRATLLLSEPSLSGDIYRYLWDGLVQLDGINPYQFAPSAGELSLVQRPDILARVNHPDLYTIYPPFAQLFFRVCATIAPEVWTIKAGVCLWDCLTVLFLVGLARSYDIHPGAVALYFWNPLVIVEGAGHGHIDLVGISLLVVALLYIRLHGYGRAAAALALAGLTKFVPVLMFPSMWRWAAQAEANGKSLVVAMFTTRAVVLPVVFIAVFVAGYVPFSDVGWSASGSLQTYATTWEFNAPVYGLLRGLGLDGNSARLVLAVCLVLAISAISVSRMPPIQAAYYVIGVFLFLTPTLHPWYVVWVVPFLCFYGNRGWIALSGLIVLAYQVLIRYHATGVWEEETWVRWVIFFSAAAVWFAPGVAARVRTRVWGTPER